jgi:hypothetical protein
VLVFTQLRRSTWDCRTVERYMVRRRSTVRFRKGAPQVRRVFCLPVRRPLPIQGEGPQFYSEAKAQVRADVSLLRGCGTVPVGRKISTIASLTGSFALARARPPSSVQCRWGANWGARSSSGGPEVSWPRPAGGPWSRSGNSARWPRLWHSASRLAVGPCPCGQGRRRSPPKIDREPDWKTCVT